MNDNPFGSLDLPTVLTTLLSRMSEREDWTNDEQVGSLLREMQEKNALALRECFSEHPADAVNLVAYLRTPSALAALREIGVREDWLLDVLESGRNSPGYHVIRERITLIWRARGLSELFEPHRTQRVITALGKS